MTGDKAYCDLQRDINNQLVTAPKTYAGRHQSICKQGRFAKDIYFALQMHRNMLSLFKRFGRQCSKTAQVLAAKRYG